MKLKILHFFKNKSVEIFLLAFSLILIIISRNYPFYWDNIVQISVPANWYFDTNFNYFFLPDDIATGHPTFIGMYFAAIWKLFGKSLFVTHLAMFPFVFGLAIQINQLIRNLEIQKNTGFVILIFVLLDTTLLSQMSLITFEVFQLFFYILCINAILNNKKHILSIAFLCLVLTSLRGTICGGGIVLFHIIYDFYKYRNFVLKRYIPYLLGIFAIIAFLFYFYFEKGWVVHNTVSNAWKESAEFASPMEILRNIGVFAWRLVDFGRVIIFVFFALFIFKLIKERKYENSTLRTLFLIIVSQFVVIFPIIIIYKNPFGHRYFIPIIIPVFILVILWVNLFNKEKKIFLTLAFTCLISGHFWLYSKKTAQGWDASTIHWNYFNVRNKMLKYLNENEININNIGTFFPNTDSVKYIDLDTKDIRFKDANINEDNFILYSNAFNVEDVIIDALNTKKKWSIIKEFRLNRIYLRLYKKND